MNRIYGYSKMQNGSFSIELVFVLFALCSIFLFATDISHKILVRSKLNSTGYSLASIIKERTRYFKSDIINNINLSVTKLDLDNLVIVSSRMLKTDPENVALKIESLVNGAFMTTFSSGKYKSLGCESGSIKDLSHLAPIENGVIYPLYRISVCEENPSWFDQFINGSKSSLKIVSSSVIPGR